MLTFTIEPSFALNDKAFLTKVTLKNTGSTTIYSVRYMRDVDPDNTVDFGGSLSTINTIEKAVAAGDKACAVSAKSLPGDSYNLLSGQQAVLAYFSDHNRCKVAFGTGSPTLYNTFVYDNPLLKGKSTTGNLKLYITFDVANLGPGASRTLTYYTALDAGNVSEILITLSCKGPSPPHTVATVAACPALLTPLKNAATSGGYSHQLSLPSRLHLRGCCLSASSLRCWNLLPLHGHVHPYPLSDWQPLPGQRHDGAVSLHPRNVHPRHGRNRVHSLRSRHLLLCADDIVHHVCCWRLRAKW